jgi:hypothetical protein
MKQNLDPHFKKKWPILGINLTPKNKNGNLADYMYFVRNKAESVSTRAGNKKVAISPQYLIPKSQRWSIR